MNKLDSLPLCVCRSVSANLYSQYLTRIKPMTILTQLNPLQWSTLPDIDDVEPLCEEDEACLQDIKTVLKKHGRLSKFGVALQHSHFPMAEDEILVEFCDMNNRTLTSKPMKTDRSDRKNAIETMWRFDSIQGKQCLLKCVKLPDGSHTSGSHEAWG